MNRLTQKHLKELLDYNPATGDFFWKVNRRSVKPGDYAGSAQNRYWSIVINRKKYRAHVLAWYYVYGSWKKLDHKNHDPLDNRISNLREASGKQNQGNRKINANNRSGLKGVSQYQKKWKTTKGIIKSRTKWKAQIGHGGKVVYLGNFPTPELAHQAYCKKAKELFGEFFCDGVV